MDSFCSGWLRDDVNAIRGFIFNEGTDDRPKDSFQYTFVQIENVAKISELTKRIRELEDGLNQVKESERKYRELAKRYKEKFQEIHARWKKNVHYSDQTRAQKVLEPPVYKYAPVYRIPGTTPLSRRPASRRTPYNKLDNKYIIALIIVLVVVLGVATKILFDRENDGDSQISLPNIFFPKYQKIHELDSTESTSNLDMQDERKEPMDIVTQRRSVLRGSPSETP